MDRWVRKERDKGRHAHNGDGGINKESESRRTRRQGENVGAPAGSAAPALIPYIKFRKRTTNYVTPFTVNAN